LVGSNVSGLYRLEQNNLVPLKTDIQVYSVYPSASNSYFVGYIKFDQDPGKTEEKVGVPGTHGLAKLEGTNFTPIWNLESVWGIWGNNSIVYFTTNKGVTPCKTAKLHLLV